MPRQTFKQELVISLCCSAVVALVMACNSSMKSTHVRGENLASKLTVGTFRHIIPANNNAPLFAALFQTAPSASDVPESFQFTCKFEFDVNLTGSSFLSTVPPGQIVPILGQLNVFPNDTCQSAFSGPQAPQVFWAARTTVTSDAIYQLEPIFHSGTIQSLVVTALTSSSKQVICSDLSDSAPVADGDVVLPYLDPHTNTVTLYNNTSSLGLSCQLSGFPAGDTFLLLSVRFAKV